MFLDNMSLLCTVYVTVILIGGVTCDIEYMPDYDPEDEIDCQLDLAKFLPQKWLLWGMPDRARQSLPPQVELRPSTIPGAGLGVYAKTFIPRYTWLAEYEGEVIVEHDHISDYAWTMRRDGEFLFYVDAYDETTSNWVRWINCSRHSKEENVMYLACRSKAFYVTFKDVYPGQELLVYYGKGYAENLEINVSEYDNEEYDISRLNKQMCWKAPGS